MRGFKETNKISWNEGKYKKTLNDEEKKVYKFLTREQKDTVVMAYLNGKPINLLYPQLQEILRQAEIEQLGYDPREKETEDLRKEEEKLKEAEQKQYDNLINFFQTQGISNPSDTTIEVFKHQQIFANFDNFYHAVGQFTLNMEKQAQYNYYMSQQKQNFINIAQQDKLIKQNEEIIQLLKMIVENKSKE